ncbi:neprilysin-1-like [Haemaphysalis longicornis]
MRQPKTVSQLMAVDESVEKALSSSDGRFVEDRRPFESTVDGLIAGAGIEVWLSAFNAVRLSGFGSVIKSPCLASARDVMRGALKKATAGGPTLAALYLAVNLEAEIALLEEARFRLQKLDPASKRFCIDLTSRCLPLTWPLLIGRFMEKSDLAPSVDAMFTSLRQALRSNTSVFSWLDDAHKAAALDRLEDTKIVIGGDGYMSLGSGDSHRSNLYAKFAPHVALGKGFVDVYLDVLNETQRMRWFAPPTREQLSSAMVEPLNGVVYEPWSRYILVSSLLLKEPYLYGSQVPLNFNYGTVGALLATKMAHTIGQASNWSGEARAKHQKSVRCLQDLRRSLDSSSSGASWSNREQEDELVAWTQAGMLRSNLTQGLRIAHAALRSWFVTASIDADVFGRYWRQAEVIFFVRFCLLSCSAANARSDSSVPARERCLVPLHNLPEFAETFSCKEKQNYVRGDCPV